MCKRAFIPHTDANSDQVQLIVATLKCYDSVADGGSVADLLELEQSFNADGYSSGHSDW